MSKNSYSIEQFIPSDMRWKFDTSKGGGIPRLETLLSSDEIDKIISYFSEKNPPKIYMDELKDATIEELQELKKQAISDAEELTKERKELWIKFRKGVEKDIILIEQEQKLINFKFHLIEMLVRNKEYMARVVQENAI